MIKMRVRVHDELEVGCLEAELCDAAIDQRCRLRQRGVEQNEAVVAGNENRRKLRRSDVVRVAKDPKRLVRGVPRDASRALDRRVGGELRERRRGGCRRQGQHRGGERGLAVHVEGLSLSNRRRILPDGDFGIASMNSSLRTFLYGATWPATNAMSSSAVAVPVRTTNARGTSPASGSASGTTAASAT